MDTFLLRISSEHNFFFHPFFRSVTVFEGKQNTNNSPPNYCTVRLPSSILFSSDVLRVSYWEQNFILVLFQLVLQLFLSLWECCIPSLLGCLWNTCAAEAQERNVCFYVPSSFRSCRTKYLQDPKYLGVAVAHQQYQDTKLVNVALSSKILCR